MPISTAVEARILELIEETGDREAVASLIRVFSEDGDQRLMRLKNAIESSNWTTSTFEAHALKSSASLLHATAVSSICKKLETCFSKEIALDLFKALEDSYSKLNRQLRAHH